MRLLPRRRYRWIKDPDGMSASLLPFVLWPWQRFDRDEHFTRTEVAEIIARSRAAFAEPNPEEASES